MHLQQTPPPFTEVQSSLILTYENVPLLINFFFLLFTDNRFILHRKYNSINFDKIIANSARSHFFIYLFILSALHWTSLISLPNVRHVEWDHGNSGIFSWEQKWSENVRSFYEVWDVDTWHQVSKKELKRRSRRGCTHTAVNSYTELML